jgi:hypothetical protein
VTTPRRLLPLLLTASCVLLVVPSAWAAFTKPRAATATFSTRQIQAPTAITAQTCLLPLLGSTRVSWTPSVTALAVPTQLVELSVASSPFVAVSQATFGNNLTSTVVLATNGAGYARVTAQDGTWYAASAPVALGSGLVC